MLMFQTYNVHVINELLKKTTPSLISFLNQVK